MKKHITLTLDLGEDIDDHDAHKLARDVAKHIVAQTKELWMADGRFKDGYDGPFIQQISHAVAELQGLHCALCHFGPNNKDVAAVFLMDGQGVCEIHVDSTEGPFGRILEQIWKEHEHARKAGS